MLLPAFPELVRSGVLQQELRFIQQLLPEIDHLGFFVFAQLNEQTAQPRHHQMTHPGYPAP